MNNNEHQIFEKCLKQLIEELVWANCYFKVWEQLWPSSKDIARVENYYINFFQLSRTAINNQFLLQLSKILERSNRSINIFRLIKMIDKQPGLTTHKLDISELKTKLDNKEEVLKRLRTLRDKKLAHIDEQFPLIDSSRKSVHVGESRALLNDLSEILTKLSVAYNGVAPSFETIGIDDTSELLEKLISITKTPGSAGEGR